ncbi:MAG TPA: hypothetical protein VFI24_27330 [Pyrinomonadaceae bacterium]|nr:hypothetical protein [Pyrinomonadaceae bacterium]
MLTPPFEIINCSWPRPVHEAGEKWVSDPEWSAPAMPYRPQPYWEMIGSELCWKIDWREFFRNGVRIGDPTLSGEMRSFHIVFKLRVACDNTLVFWDDDGSIIRRNGELVYTDRNAHMLQRNEIPVHTGDILEVGQWQFYGDWMWGARAGSSPATNRATELVSSYLPRVQQRLADPNGPPLKFYTHGRSALRAVISVYSLILHGYAPSKILLFGEDQWSEDARSLFRAALPFAEVIPTKDVLHRIHLDGNSTLSEYARRFWFVMKACIGLLHPPAEFCLIDDDVFVLDSVADALQAFTDHDLVYIPDTDHGNEYRTLWTGTRGDRTPLATGCFNAGLYWMRNVGDLRQVANRAIRIHPSRSNAWNWEQGFIACWYADRRTFELSTKRYFYPLFDGLPGGILGYDYAGNPCGFASVHFGGLTEKPTDDAMYYLAPDILGPKNS